MNTLFQKTAQFYVVTILITIISGVTAYAIISQTIHDELIQDYQKHGLTLFDEEIHRKISIIEAVAITYANLDSVKNALSYEDREELHKLISPSLAQHSRQTEYKQFAFHFISFDGRSIYRSYNLESFGQNVSQHPLVKQALLTQKPSNGTFIGGYSQSYRLIHIQPIFEDEELLGFIAVSQGLRRLVDYLPEQDYTYALFSAEKIDVENRKFNIDKRDYFQSSPIKEITLLESELREKDFIDSQVAEQIIYLVPILDSDNRPLAFHTISLPQPIFSTKLWEQQKSLIIIIGLGVLLFSTFAIIYLSEMRLNISRPLAKLTSTIAQIIQTSDYSNRVSIKSDDEIGRLSDFFDHMISNTEEMLHRLNYQQDIIDRILIVSKTDPNGNITYVNDKFCEISGYSREELVGQAHNIVRHPKMPSSTFADIWKTIKSKRTWSGEIRNIRKDGSDYFVQSHIIPILNKKGEIAEIISIREDITNMVRLRKSLEKSMANETKERLAAERANQAKSEFLSSMSHELRTPLNSIIGFSQLLEISELDDKQLRQVTNIHNSGQHLLDLINDVLSFSKLEGGEISLSIENTKLTPLLKEICAVVESQLNTNNINIEIEPNNKDYAFLSDRVRIKQVLLNIVSNAIKYNKEGGTIYLSWNSSQENGDHFLVITIKDTGVGISKEHMKKLFEPFNRLGHEGSNIEGTGIGLTITKSLIEKMHGFLEVDSEEGIGTTFRVYMPLVEEFEINTGISKEETSTQEFLIEEHSSDTNSLRILYIEDNLANIELMQDLVNSVDDSILYSAETAEEGLQIAKENKPNLVFMDINLPGLNGDEALPFYKALPELREIKPHFFALSANAMQRQIDKGLEAGFEDYLSKPIDINQLRKIIEQLSSTG